MTIKITKCTVCEKPIEYTTKKPMKCQECKKPRTEPKTPKSKWKKETQMFSIMALLLPSEEYIVNGYYSWLPSPKGMPMQLDWYTPGLRIAVEYEGSQHYKYNRYFHKTKKQFNYLKQCDELKAKLCKAHGVTLVSIRYDKALTPQYIADELKKANPELFAKLIESKRLNI